MKSSRVKYLSNFFCVLCIVVWSGALVFAEPSKVAPLGAVQIEFAPVIVQGRTLTGPNSSAQRRDGRILLPVAAVAKALGDTLGLDAANRIVNVRRQTGITGEYNGRTGQIREGAVVILSLSNSGEITFSATAEEIMLPIEIAAALFDVSVRYDAAKNAVVVNRGHEQTQVPTDSDDQSFAELYQANYEYSLYRYSAAASHNLTLTAAGRIADGRFLASSNSSKSTDGQISMRNFTFGLDRPNGQRFIAGDLGTGGNLQFLSANIRGGSAAIPVSDTIVTAFAGRAYSGIGLSTADLLTPVTALNPVIRDPFGYDTNVFGALVTTNSPNRTPNTNPLGFSAGVMGFSGVNRSGELATGSVNYEASRFRLQGDFGFGKFEGLRTASKPSGGIGAAVDLAGTFQVKEDLAVHARFTNIGKNFLSPQVGFREPLDLKAAGVTWSRLNWFSASVNASSARRPGDSTQDNRFVTGAFAVTPSSGLPRFYFSHTQTATKLVRSGAFTTLNASEEFSRLRLYLNATRIKNIGPAFFNAQLGANYSLNNKNSLEFNQGLGSRGSLNGQFDWRASNLFKGRLNFSAGGGYNYSETAGVSIYQRLTAAVGLPRQTSLQMDYYRTDSGPTLLLSLKGLIFRRSEGQAFLESPLSEMNSYGGVSGRVYQDIDQNGRFDPAVDKPQAEVKVRVDGNRYVVTDENGLYSFDSMAAGDHKVYLDLLSVRADLTMLDGPARDTKLTPGRKSTFDFRLVRTGRISGRVWFDANENGILDEGETPLADIRVVTATGRDTLTDTDGYFVIGDLSPGEHVIMLDEKTLPAKTVAASQPLAIHAFAGRETGNVGLRVIFTPPEVRRFGSSVGKKVVEDSDNADK